MNMDPRILQNEASKSHLCHWVIIYEFHFVETNLVKLLVKLELCYVKVSNFTISDKNKS